jgi:ETC complex I subunit-like protein
MQHARKHHISAEIQPTNPRPINIDSLNGLPEAANLNQGPTPTLGASIFPAGAVARIYRPARSAMTSGRARTKRWLLRFDRRTPPFIEPLMGWTGGDDTLTQIELRFPTSEAAVAYARRQGLAYVVDGRGVSVAQQRREERRTA